MQINGISHIESNKTKDIFISVIINCTAAICIITQNIRFIDNKSIIYDIVLIITYGIMFILYKSFKNKKKSIDIIIIALILLNIFNLTNNAAYCMNILTKDASPMDQSTYSMLINSYDRIINNLKEYDSGLYRIEKDFRIGPNDSTMFGYNGISFSGSTYSKNTHEFLKKLGMARYHVHVLYNGRNTKGSDMILGIKYIIIPQYYNNLKNYEIKYEDLFMVNNMKICQNPYSLALGYCVNEDILNTKFEENNTFEYQNELLSNITKIDERVYLKHDGEIKKTNINLKEEKSIYYIENEGEESKIVYEFVVQNEKNLYSYIVANSDHEVKIYVNNEEFDVKKMKICNETINLGKRNIGDKIKIEVIPQKELYIKNIYAYYEDEEVLKKHYEKISKEQVDIIKIDNREYKGNVQVNDDNQCVLFTIPYDEGWQIMVDGEKVKYEEALDALIMIRLPKGEHEIVLRYLPSKINVGIALSIIGILLFIIRYYLIALNK